MAYLIALGGHRLELPTERMSFGSDESNDVPIPDAYSLAPLHFALEPSQTPNTYQAIACAEDVDVFVNGDAVRECDLKEGDHISAGDLRATFHTGLVETPVAAPVQQSTPAPIPLGSAPAFDFGGNRSSASIPTAKKTSPASRRRKLRPALIGVSALTILGGGVFAAQKTGVLDYALNSSPEDHFDFLEENLPSGFDAYVSCYFAPLIKEHSKEDLFKGIKTVSASMDVGEMMRLNCVAEFNSDTNSEAFIQNLQSQPWMDSFASNEEALKGITLTTEGSRAILKMEKTSSLSKRKSSRPTRNSACPKPRSNQH